MFFTLVECNSLSHSTTDSTEKYLNVRIVFYSAPNRPGRNLGARISLPPKKVASGGWRVASGGWRVASGGWRVAGGGWRVASGGWRVASEQKNDPVPTLSLKIDEQNFFRKFTEFL